MLSLARKYIGKVGLIEHTLHRAELVKLLHDQVKFLKFHNCFDGRPKQVGLYRV